MRGRLAALLLVVAAPLPALAQPPLDPAALELARVLMTQDDSLEGHSDIGSVRSRIENILLGEAGSCNPSLADCRMAAAQAVERYAEAFMREERERRVRINAYLLADTLRPEEMARFAQFLGSAEGNRLVMAMGLLRNRDRTARRRRELERVLERTTPAALAEARADFRRRARNIPRAAPR
jgi:hypothetical protein